MATENIVIVGGGLAGGTAARTLRAQGHGGPVILLAAERHHPYLRPPLSKDYLLGKAGEDALPVAPADWYGENGVELRLGTPVTGIDPAARTVAFDGGTLEYASLLLATGARPRHLRLPGSDLAGVGTFRTVDDSRHLRTGLAGGGRNVVMIGSGWIGMELAAAASSYGNSITLLGLEEVPLAAAIGPELGGFFRSLHESNGVRFRLPASAAGIRGKSGRVTGVLTDSGEVLSADLVIIAVGVVPEVSLAEAAGITLRNGILTDASLRTSAPGIYAAGDVANALHPFTGEHHRSEHWSNALNGGKVAARAMLGLDAKLDTIPYFYTDQFDVSMEYSGFPALVAGKPTIRGSLEGKEFLAFWQRDGRVVAGMNVNWPRAAKPQKIIKQLITAATAVDPHALADPDVPLDQLIPAG
ncbi:NADPH-dependent 2,4-dienoyl-CoA reductase/sulfur reductase-like enzyme [Arthrobacter ginsengisoli]|uniref:NADPH-dependent 2,4-dienoyl-CoA reductase/sulfur reductase-like enzyme n=1 Tax=Arthrobacter ginsengisoli TaxID=1356565 RepID=A0ABU1UB31_9MICC|nr:FAD-dependent oxidoreductase [Arthrobacter ginsengisoli]MDR7082413.1 NADPH-dependent 2,4-dienoyl-CoA reductase/sulfur reductase-like enzyme [Arthrobacter ginsengisoli]